MRGRGSHCRFTHPEVQVRVEVGVLREVEAHTVGLLTLRYRLGLRLGSCER